VIISVQQPTQTMSNTVVGVAYQMIISQPIGVVMTMPQPIGMKIMKTLAHGGQQQ